MRLFAIKMHGIYDEISFKKITLPYNISIYSTLSFDSRAMKAISAMKVLRRIDVNPPTPHLKLNNKSANGPVNINTEYFD